MKHKELAKQKGFASVEEYFFWFWCTEAFENGVIKEFEYSQETHDLSKKQLDSNGKFLMHPHIYTDDFLVYGIDKKYGDVLKKFFRPVNGNNYFIDIKGNFNKYSGDREFSINQKWMMQKHGIYINKIVPDKLFEKTWVPECPLKYTEKTKVIQKKYKDMKTVKQFIEGYKNV